MKTNAKRMTTKILVAVLLILVMIIEVLPMMVFAEESTIPFTATAGGEAITEIVKGTHTNYGQDYTLYTITIPAGTETVTLTWDQEVVGFSTDATNDECWDLWDEDPHTTIDASVDGNEDGVIDYLYVSEDVDWENEEQAYFITFVEEIPGSVYISVSNDGEFVTATGGTTDDTADDTTMAYVPVALSDLQKIDLDEYGMSDYKYDADSDGTYEITVLHLFIYAHETLYGGSWSDVTFSGNAGSLYFNGGLFGFTENMTYYHNGTYPIDDALSEAWGSTTGATADHIVLQTGDFVDLAGYSDYSFWMDENAGFRYFCDEQDAAALNYSTKLGTALTVSLGRATQDWSTGALVQAMVPATEQTVCYSQTLLDEQPKTVTTDGEGKATITFDKAGVWYLWSAGDGVSSPACAKVTVQWENPYTDVTAYWPNFRNSLYNMAVTDAKTPASATTTVEKWVRSFGSGSPSGMIIADDALIFMCGSNLKKVDLQTGEVIAEGTMSAGCLFAIISPTYANGLIFCPLSGGKIEAFDVKTLESKWIFTDALGGQNNTPITYADGYLYTGYWYGETAERNFVCVNASTGELVWSKAVPGGFYWAGSTVVGDAVIVGSDDGTGGFEGDSHLYALNRLTGEVISDITLTGMGDQRSTIAYSAEKGRVYFTTKNGYIASAAVDASTGALSDLKSNKVASQATATPVVYGDKVFVGAGGGMQVGSTAGNLFVVDANSLEYLYEISLKGYPQGSILISTAYLEETGKLYCYATYNSKPGGLTLIKIDPTKNDASGAEIEEIYAAPGHEQYCLISPICGSDGTIYYRNDSGYIFALTTNDAYLTGLNADVGTFSESFTANDMSYELVVPIGTQSVTLTPTACEGGTAEAVTATLTDGTATAEIVVNKGEDTRTYTVSIREVSADATLSELKVNESNSYGTTLELTTEFAANTYYYGVYDVSSARNFVNVWPTAADVNATVKIFALSNVKDTTFDTETKEIAVTATNSSHDRYAIYFADDTKPMAVRIVVTAENGDTASYTLVLSKEAAATAGDTLLEQIRTDDLKAKAVTDKITAIGEVTLDSKTAIEAARSAYNALTEEQKALVTNYGTLTAAETKLAELQAAADKAAADKAAADKAAADKAAADKAAADAVATKIAAIGTVTADSKDAIEAARAAYDALTEEQKSLVSGYNALLSAEAELTQLNSDSTEESNSAVWWIVGGCALVVIACGAVFGVWFYKRRKNV